MKLSDLKLSEDLSKSFESLVLGNPDARENIEKIVYTKNTDTLPVTCDVGIVFGGFSMIPHRVEKAERLYKEGLLEKIIVTGGIGYLSKDRVTPEAVKMQDYLFEKGIPKKDILLEDKARSTFENIKYSLELIKEKCDLEKMKLALITSDFHLRRCTGMTLMATNNKTDIFGCGAKDGITDIESWYTSTSTQITIYHEALNLRYYTKHGDMCDLEIDDLKRKRIRSK